MTIMRWICCALLTGMMQPVISVAEDPSFRFSRPIEMALPAEEELFALPLDSDIYAATGEEFPDIRVLDADDRLVPFLIRRVTEARTEKIRKRWTAANPALKPLGDQGMEIRLVLAPEDPIPLGLTFVTPLRDFEQQIQIFSTGEGTESLLVDEALIFDYSKLMDIRHTDVSLPSTTAREFRIVIGALTVDQESQLLELTRSLQSDEEDNRTESTTIQRRPFRIERIELWTEQAEKIRQVDIVQPWPVTSVKVTQDAEQKQTLVELQSHREPLTALKINTSSRNFSRVAEVQVERDSGSGMEWETVANTAISQFQLRDFREEHLTISLPETRCDHLRLVILNGDSPQIAIESIEAVGPQYEVVFLGKPNQNVRLAYGSDTAEPPEHDTVALNTALAKGIRPLPATLGVQSAIADTGVNKSLKVKNLLNSPLVLGAVIGILVIALGWGLFQASRRIDQMPREDAD